LIRGSVIRNLSENKSTAFIRSTRRSSKNKALLLFEAQGKAAKTKHCFVCSARRSGKIKHCFYSKRKAKRQNKALLCLQYKAKQWSLKWTVFATKSFKCRK